jgi:hypothetical protein
MSSSENDIDLPDGDRGLGDLLGAFLGQAGGNAPGGGSDDMLSSLLGGLMGGATGAPSGGTPSSSGNDFADLLGSLSQPGSGSGQPAPAGGADLDDLLGGLLGGGGGAPASGGGIGDLLGGLLGGGGGSAGGGGVGALLGGLLGGGGQPNTFGGGGGMMLPFAETLAKKLGISPQVANSLIGAALGLLMSSVVKQRQGDRSAQGLSMNSLMDPDFLRQSGAVSQVSQETGLDEDEAIRGLQQAIGLAGKAAPAPSAPATPPGPAEPPKDDLKGLLDDWK